MGLIQIARQLWNIIGAKTAEGSIEPPEVNAAAQAILDAVEGIATPVFEYSINGTSNWHATATSNDYYMRVSFDGGASYSNAMLFKGTSGSNGVGIASISRTSGTGAAGTTDTYTFTFTDNSTTTFTVYNGGNGTNGTNGKSGWLYTPAYAATTDSIIPDFENELWQTTNTGTAAIAITDFLNLPTTSTERLLVIYNNRASAMTVTFRTADLAQNGWTYQFENMMPATCSIPAGKRCEICYLFEVSGVNTMKVVITYLVQS